MKTITFLCAFFLTSFFLNAQTEFAPSGAKWTYGFSNYNLGNFWDGYETITYIGDTLIDDISMKIMERFSYIKTDETTIQSSFLGNYYIYQVGQKVFEQSGELLYDFEKEPGDSLVIAHNPEGWWDPIELIVLAKEVEMINDSETITFTTITNCGSPYTDTLAFNSSLASFNYFYAGFNHCIVDLTPVYHLRCYEDDVLGFYQISEEACDDIQLVAGTKEVFERIYITLAPNPTSDKQFQLLAETLPPNAEIRLYSSLGQLLFTEKWIQNEQVFSLPHGGLFYVVVFSEGRQVAVRKVVAME